MSKTRLTKPLDALPAFLEFSSAAKARVEAHPDWVEWLKKPGVLNPATSGKGRWKKNLWTLAGEGSASAEKTIAALRLLRQREYLRLGLLDFSGQLDVEELV